MTWGSPVSVVVANLVMEDVQDRALRDSSTLYDSGSSMLIMLTNQLYVGLHCVLAILVSSGDTSVIA